MKVGILTFHSQTNYGGVLQAFALQETLRRLGHNVVVVDKWMDEHNCALKGITASHSLVGWLKFIGRAALGFGDFADYIRHVRTVRMLPSLLNLTPYSFYHWKDAPERLGVDVIVVGSDQVWNPRLQGEELPYLLEGAPSVPAVAYAASFGMPKLPSEVEKRYRVGLRRFKAISVREEEGVRIVEALGRTASHVLDPTLLADVKTWDRFVANCKHRHENNRRKLVCYLIQDPLGFAIKAIKRFAAACNSDAEIFFGTPCTLRPTGIRDLLKISSGPISALLSPGVHSRATATPDEFVSEIASADWVLTDSFHALMFSTIFKRNVRLLKPRNGRGEAGFARLEEFAKRYYKTRILCNDYDEAFRSFLLGERSVHDESLLSMKKAESLNWLVNALAGIRSQT